MCIRDSVEGTLQNFAFNRSALEGFRSEIISMLNQLPDSFMDDGGMGISLMQMVATKDDELWGEQYTADELFVLAKGLGLAKFTLPREMWQILPGAMPYITVSRSEF